MVDKFKQLNEQIAKSQEKVQVLHEKVASLEKENSSNRGKII